MTGKVENKRENLRKTKEIAFCGFAEATQPFQSALWPLLPKPDPGQAPQDSAEPQTEDCSRAMTAGETSGRC